MTIAPKSVYIAEALADLAKPRVIEAHEYLAKWASLQSAGVPPVTIRHTIERHLDTTPALGMVEGWAKSGERGLLALAGEVGCGKSLAAAWWLTWRSGHGRWSRWLSCASWGRLDWDEIRPMLTGLVKAPALVVDDIGAGMARGTGFTDAISGVLLERQAVGRPTILCANGGAAEMQTWLDPRIVDRLKEGGAIPELRPITSMREDDDETLDAAGRGKVWRLSRALVDAFGCIEASVYDHEAQAYSATELRVGGELVSATGRHGERALRQAFELAQLEAAPVMERARELEANDKTTELEAHYSAAIAKLADENRRQKLADDKARDDNLAAMMSGPRRKPGAASDRLAADKRRLEGLTVKPLSKQELQSRKVWLRWAELDGAFEVRIGDVKAPDKRYKGRLMAHGFESEEAAWTFASTLFAVPSEVSANPHEHQALHMETTDD